MKQQVWFCEHCKTIGEVRYEDGILPMSMKFKLENDHRRVNPRCHEEVGITHQRIVNAHHPDWADMDARLMEMVEKQDYIMAW